MKNKFDKAIPLLPKEMVSQGRLEQRTDSIGLWWPGGSLFFGENRGIGEFVLHVFNIGEKKEFYAPYPAYPKSGELNLEEIAVIAADLSKFKVNLIT